ncbi:MAG: sigma-E factor negative regulatory protein RseA [Comamonadaceae bacterium]|nr:MAG: sigma-E factor negative regulatory protein RseA [Comamonadaceae bacterium]
MVDQSAHCAQQISALVDGQLPDDEWAQVLSELESNEQARADWDVYHLVGDVMRANQTPVRAHDPEFLLKLRSRLTHDATEIVAVDALSIRDTGQKYTNIEAANEPVWRLVAGLASVAVVSVLAWQGLHWVSSADPAAVPQLAQQQSVPESISRTAQVLIRSDGSSALALNAEPQVMIRDPQLDALLAAHRQFGGGTALQMPAGFLRQAAFASGGR